MKKKNFQQFPTIIHLIILNALIFCFVFLLNRLTLYTSDDFAYHFVYEGFLPSSHPIPISGWWSIIQSQLNHWHLWNGRFVAHTIVQFFMQYDKLFFDIANSLAVLALIALIHCLARAKFSNKSFITILTAFYLWWFLPEIGKSVLWLSGSGNYLWTSIVYLTYLCLIERRQMSIFLIPLGFLAGACNENSSPTVLLMASFWWLYYCWSERKIWINGLLSLFSGGAAFLLMLLSPGSQARGHMIRTAAILIENARNIAQHLVTTFGIIYLLLVLTIIYLRIHHRLTKPLMGRIGLFLLGHFISAFVLIASPEVPDRTFFGSSIFLAIALFAGLNALFFDALFWPKVVLTFGLGILFLGHYTVVVKDLRMSYQQVSNQYAILRSSQQSVIVELPIATPPQTLYNAYHGTANLSPNEIDWFNQWMAAYFNVKGVRGY